MDPKIYYTRKRYLPVYMDALRLHMESGNYGIFPMKRTTVLGPRLIPNGVPYFSFKPIENGQIPMAAFLFFIPESSASGNFNSHPFKFDNMNVNNITVEVNGVEVSRIDPKWDLTLPSRSSCLEMFLQQIQILTGLDNAMTTNDIEYKDFIRDYVVFPIKFCQNQISRDFKEPCGAGEVHIQIKFNAPTARL